MKTTYYLLTTIILLTITSCATTKNSKLYGNSWQLEYISGTKIAFEGLYPNKKPQITFNKEKNKVQGNNSCNGYSANYTIKDSSIYFSEPGPSTMMYCGEGEQAFLKMMEKVNRFSFDDNGKLNLMLDDVTVLRFKKVTK